MRRAMTVACLAGAIGLVAAMAPAWADDPPAAAGEQHGGPQGQRPEGHPQGRPEQGRPVQGGPQAHPPGQPAPPAGAQPGMGGAALRPPPAQPGHPPVPVQTPQQPPGAAAPAAPPPHQMPPQQRSGQVQAPPGPGFGQGPREGWGERQDWRERHVFREHDFRHFGEHDRELWSGGAWQHGLHDGRLGWWWTVGGVWYFYDQPVYPFPTVVSETYYVEEQQPAVVEVAPAAPAQPTLFWLYCDNPPGYYPFVSACSQAFRPVPAPNQ